MVEKNISDKDVRLRGTIVASAILFTRTNDKSMKVKQYLQERQALLEKLNNMPTKPNASMLAMPKATEVSGADMGAGRSSRESVGTRFKADELIQTCITREAWLKLQLDAYKKQFRGGTLHMDLAKNLELLEKALRDEKATTYSVPEEVVLTFQESKVPMEKQADREGVVLTYATSAVGRNASTMQEAVDGLNLELKSLWKRLLNTTGGLKVRGYTFLATLSGGMTIVPPREHAISAKKSVFKIQAAGLQTALEALEVLVILNKITDPLKQEQEQQLKEAKKKLEDASAMA